MTRTATKASRPLRLDDASLFVNRELSLLRFHERVLEEAEDERNPLLERVRFLSIFSSNVSEFYMVRVAGLRQQVDAGVTKLSEDGLTPTEQLQLVRGAAVELLRRAREAYVDIARALEAEGIRVLDYADLTDAERECADAFFETQVFPVLTPLAFDPGRPFPHISNLSMNLAAVVRDADGEERFARVKIPRALPRLIELTCSVDASRHAKPREYRFVWLEQVVAAHLGTLFPGLTVVSSHPFRVTRDAEMIIQELEADDLLQTIEAGVRRRRFGSVVRMTVEPDMPDYIRETLVKNLKMDAEDVVAIKRPLGMSELAELCAIDRPDLKFHTFVPAQTIEVGDDGVRDMFAAIRQRDILLHHPYESFQPVVDLLKQAAHDPDVLAIKATLYRVGKDSPIVEALMEAAEEGKEVACLVELKARFDEESNIEWARALEQVGVHVVYGLVGLKTHSKVLLVVRRERDGIRRYVHIGTGNYNLVTARQYTDLGLLTCDPKIGADASELFNVITGYATESHFRRLFVAPTDLRDGVERLIRREAEHAAAGRGGRILFKMNALVDQPIITALYEASQAGAKIDMIVRGACSLRPGVPGVSDNITVTSILGRFLEHSRIYYFENAGEPIVLIGSADMMVRNLDRRIEVLTPVTSAVLMERLRDEILGTYFRDDAKARRMLPDGTYERVVPADGTRPLEAQTTLLTQAAKASVTPAPKKRKKLRALRSVKTREKA